MKFGLGVGLENQSMFGASDPGLALSASSVPENSAQGTDIATLTATNASNPGAFSIASQEVANLFQVSAGVPSFVGQKATKGTLVGTSVSLDLTTLSAGTLAGNDIVVGVFALGANADWSPSITTSGYTILTNTRSDDSNDAHLLVGIKRMGATPDTVLDFANTSAATSAYNAVAYVIRGVDEATALSVASTLAQGTNTAIPNPGAIDPGVEGSLIVVVAANAHQLGAAPGALSASYLSNVFTDTADSAGRDGSVLIGTLPWDGVGAYDPAAITWDQADNITDSWVTLTIAFRPAVSMLQVGSGAAGLNYEVRTSATVTLQYTDDAGVHQSVKTITITDVADGPTITGAASDLATELGTPTVGTPLSFDARDIFVSPTGQTLTFSALSHGAMNVDGFTVEWTPTSQEYTDGDGIAAFSITATDEDGQSLIAVAFVAMAAVNTPPTAINQTGTFSVPEGSAPVFVSSSPADDATGVAVATDPTLTADRDILFGTGNVYTYSVTGTAIIETFDVEVDIGGGAGTLSIVDNVLTIEPTSDFGESIEVALKWDLGALTNLGGIPIAANTSNTMFSFTTATGASAPAQFSAGQWSVTDLATSLDVRIAISALPSDGGSSITDLEYQRDGGTWTSLGGTSTGNYDITVPANGTSYAFAIRAVNAIGNGTGSATKNATATGVPAAFGTGDWSIADAGTTGDATITISTLAANNGATITDIEAQIDGGSWVSLGISTTTTANLAGFTDTVESDVAIRAVNSVGNGTASATKPVTTTTSSADTITTHASLSTGLVSWWEMDEASGTRVDDHGSNDLADNNTVGSTTGVEGNAALFVAANTEYLSITDASQSGLDITGDLSVNVWVNPTSPPSTGTDYWFVTKWTTSGNQRAYRFGYQDAASVLGLSASFSNTGAGGGAVTNAVITQDLGTGTFKMVTFAYDASAGSVEMFVNGSSVGTVGSQKTVLFNSTAPFLVGAINTGVLPADAAMDKVGVWSKVLTGTEITDLYASGAGMAYV